MRYVNTEPTDEGYRNIAMRFADDLINSKTYKKDREMARAILRSLVEISAYLGAKRPDLAHDVLHYIQPQQRQQRPEGGQQ